MFINYSFTGINDSVSINSGPNVVTPGTTVQYSGAFFDEPPATSPVPPWSWKIELHHQDGWFEYTQGDTGSFYSAQLPGTVPQTLQWDRDANQDIVGRVSVLVKDSDGYFHAAEKPIALHAVPNKPDFMAQVLSATSVKLTYFSRGGTSTYRIRYGIHSGGPYNGPTALEGPSPINVGANTSVVLNGFNFLGQVYYFAATGVNAYGESELSNELSVGKRPTPVPAMSRRGIAGVFALLLLTGASILRSASKRRALLVLAVILSVAMALTSASFAAAILR
jgi:hypothetical protein